MSAIDSRSCVACSTPFGITEGITTCGPRLARQGVRVLNAFRHHGGHHIVEPFHRLLITMCSTPFGITEGITYGFVPRMGAVVGCSTPFGITEGITVVR